MQEQPPPREYIEITIYPEGRMDLHNFLRALTALNREYRQWLKENHTFDHNDQDLRLFVEKVSDGSIKIWLTKQTEILLNCLEGFFQDYILDFITKLIRKKLEESEAPRSRLLNTRDFLCEEFEFLYESRDRKVSLKRKITKGNVKDVQEEITRLLEIKRVEKHERETIKFAGFHRNNDAKVVAPKFSSDEVKTRMAQPVRQFFLKEENNFLHPEKEYRVDLEITYMNDEIESYYIKNVLGS